MPIDCVVLDLDGTCTDLALEAPAFNQAFPRLLADLLGRDLGRMWPDAYGDVAARSPELAWMIGGHAIAPADADPYVHASVAAQLIFDRLDLLRDVDLRSDITTTVYRRAYHATGASFRPEAKHVIETLVKRGLYVCVVTNAESSAARKKLASLVPDVVDQLRIEGDARKYVITRPEHDDARWAQIPSERRADGLARPILLHRGKYFDALSRIWAKTGARPETTLVCGDIYELDLALPAELGASVHLVERERTFAYERSSIAALGARGAVGQGLSALLDRAHP
jgi:phosphoglycolate phosphatase-like HAD superfamily hydrolase